MAGLDPGIDATTVLIWLAGALAAIILAAVLAWRRGQAIMPGLAVAFALAAALGGAALLALRPQSRPEDRAAEWHRLVRRADDLAARAFAPNSPLACVDASAGRAVDQACEALLFGRPDTIAAAVAYVEAKLALVSDAAGLGDASAKSGEAIAALRRDLEADRFGIVAHVLAARPQCNADRCVAFALVTNADRIRMNMREGAFNQLVARYAGNWPAGDRETAATDAASPKSSAASPTGVAKPLSPGYDFPSAASIPPVSIMTTEPPRPAEPAAASAAPVESAARKPSSPPSASPPVPRAAPRPAPGPVSIAPTRPAPPAAETPGPN
jgi:hypothetical protein